MEIEIFKDDGHFVIRMAGRFDIQCQKTFLDAMAQAVADRAREIQLDFGGVEYIDSSALGMLLVARDSAKAAAKVVSLVNVAGSARLVLDIANFGKVFPID